MFLNAFVAQMFRIPSESMLPTLQIGDRVVANKLQYHFTKVKHGDIVVFRTPDDKKSIVNNSEYLIKRVVARGGDTLSSKDGVLFRNGRPADEKYLGDDVGTYAPGGGNMPEITIPKGRLYMMGDNRGSSTDSRFIDTVPEENVVGKANVRLFPFTRIGFFN